MARVRLWTLAPAFLLACCGGPEPVPQVPPEAPSEVPRVEVAELRRALEADPDNPVAIRSLAIALFESGSREEAVELFEQAVALDPNPRSLLDLALGYTNVSRLPEAESVYQRMLELSPGHPIALHNLGNVAVSRGDPDLGISYYEQAIAGKPDYLLAYFHLAEALNRAGRHREAYATYAKVLELDPTDAQELEAFDNSLYRMAALDITMGAPQRAAEMLVMLLEENPDHPSAHYAYGQALVLLGRPEEAQREFEIHMRILAETESSSPMGSGS